MVRVHFTHLILLPAVVVFLYVLTSLLGSGRGPVVRNGQLDVQHHHHAQPGPPPLQGGEPARNSEMTNGSTVKLLQNIVEMKRESRVECDKIMAGDAIRMISAQKMADEDFGDEDEKDEAERTRVTKIILTLAKRDCKSLKRDYGFITDTLTQEEREFPIAFSLVVHDHMDLLINLMSAIYRPQNVYCLHMDARAQPAYGMVVTHFAGCFPNVFAPRARVNVTWGRFSVVQADIRCMQILNKKKGWKYLINLSGDDFPLKTNYELVQILKAYGGANDVFGSHIIRRPRRWSLVNVPQPPDLTLVNGHRHIAVNPEFVKFVLFSNVSKALQKFVSRAVIPDEVFFPTINHNPHLGIHGSFRGLTEVEADLGRKPSFTRFKLWFTDACSIKVEGGVCTLGIGELFQLTRSPHMFANKFHIPTDPLVVGCMAEWMANQTLNFYLGQATIDTTKYRNSVIVTNMVEGNRTDDGYF